ncbi:hypothetical protein TNCV_2124521 [Trichonephila clavipes]|uniref:Uncharacterized protein n=1 Tax=Trichonephila clavipes TaxID=2585209 RepID=A0A8X6R3K7_TRICX|nr:hypothetical protein TNCV_2124521 [Trichonephila clavipes]
MATSSYLTPTYSRSPSEVQGDLHIFTDESRFSTRSDSQHVLIWREIGTRFYPSNIKQRHPSALLEFLSGEALC